MNNVMGNNKRLGIPERLLEFTDSSYIHIYICIYNVSSSSSSSWLLSYILLFVDLCTNIRAHTMCRIIITDNASPDIHTRMI